MQFIVSEDQRAKANAWHLEIQKRIIADDPSKEDPALKGYVYYGAIGGGLHYIFIPTSIGELVRVKEYFTGEELDLTEYSNW